eukprot:11424761-Prorocentrum_lima.AAC.1
MFASANFFAGPSAPHMQSWADDLFTYVHVEQSQAAHASHTSLSFFIVHTVHSHELVELAVELAIGD